MEKEDLMEALAAELLERKALDLILDSATYEDYEMKPDEQQGEVATVDAGAPPKSAMAEQPTRAPPRTGRGDRRQCSRPPVDPSRVAVISMPTDEVAFAIGDR